MNSAFGKRLREYRTDRKILQGTFAEACGISPAYLSDIERGKRNPPADKMILEWSRYLDTGVAEEIGQELIGLAAQDRGQAEAITETVVVETDTLWKTPERGERDEPSTREKSKTPFLDHFLEDMSALAAEDVLDPAPGHDWEIQEIASALARRAHNSVVLTASSRAEIIRFVSGLACEMIRGKNLGFLAGKRILRLDPGVMMMGAKYRGQLEERLIQPIREVKEDGDIILFCPSLADLIDLEEKATGSFFQAGLQAGWVRIIAGAVQGEIEACVKTDPGITECFRSVAMLPLDQEGVLKGLRELSRRYGAFHGVTYSEEALKAIVNAAEPGDQAGMWQRALDLLDDVGVRMRMA